MRILIVAATAEEIRNLEFEIRNLEIDFLVAGVGIAATTYSLTKKLSSQQYDLAINIGVAGSFKNEIAIGETVLVVSDMFADVGAEDDDKFLSVFELGLEDKDRFPFSDGDLKCNMDFEKYSSLQSLKKVKAITVNTVHGNERSIQKAIQKFNPDIESMEGAAFFYCCMMEKIPCLQLRAISNRVERRNRAEWDIPVALNNLYKAFNSLLSDLDNDTAD
jgi:futalosine hydrolase